jgi:hypothetical protein
MFIGILKGFDVHYSHDYILLLSNLGFVDIYRARSGEMRGRIEVPYFSSGNLLVEIKILLMIICYLIN